MTSFNMPQLYKESAEIFENLETCLYCVYALYPKICSGKFTFNKLEVIKKSSVNIDVIKLCDKQNIRTIHFFYLKKKKLIIKEKDKILKASVF